MLLSLRRSVLFVVGLLLILSFGLIDPGYLSWREINSHKYLVELPGIFPVPVPQLDNQGKIKSGLSQEALDPLYSISARSYGVIDVDSGTVLLEKNFRQPLPPASTLKMMTAIVARAYLPEDQLISVIGSDGFDDSHQVFGVGDQLTVHDLLRALLVPSSNAAGRMLGRAITEAQGSSSDVMAQHASLFGLTDSKFVNATGIDANGQVTSVRDLALLGRRLMQDEQLRQIVGQKTVEMTASPSGKKYVFNTTNLLLNSDSTVKGIKTGTTPQAGEVLVSWFERNGHKYLVVVMGSRDRFADTLNLVARAQTGFTYETVGLR